MYGLVPENLNRLNLNKVGQYLYLAAEYGIVVVNDAVTDFIESERFCGCLLVRLCADQALCKNNFYLFHENYLLMP